MIHYHGLPITPEEVAVAVLKARHAFVSFAHRSQINIASQVCQSFAIDNGAYSFWKSGKKVDWGDYYTFLEGVKNNPRFDFAVVPDVIEGSEKENDALLLGFPLNKFYSVPVWHLHESIGRLKALAEGYPRIAFGSSGEYSTVGNAQWSDRMDEAFSEIVDSRGMPVVKVHGLRMLNPKVFTRYPFSSVDSTNIARNVGIDKKWKGTYQPASKKVRGLVLADRIENHTSPDTFIRRI